MNDHNRGSRAAKAEALNPSRDGQAEWLNQPLSVTRRKTGSAMFPPEAWRQIASNLKLSGRELQIVRGTFDDQTESTIAAGLRIAASTVHTHIGRLHHKLAVTNRAQLILRVMQEFMGLTAPPRNQLSLICASRAEGRRPLRFHAATSATRRLTACPRGA